MKETKGKVRQEAGREERPDRKGARAAPANRESLRSGTSIGEIPRGIEVLVKKASVDARFKELLVETRAKAAREINLKLDPAERAILNNTPKRQLEAIISRTKVSWKNRAVFLGRAAAVMLAALGTVTLPTGCGTKGIQPDETEVAKSAVEAQGNKKASPDVEI